MSWSLWDAYIQYHLLVHIQVYAWWRKWDADRFWYWMALLSDIICILFGFYILLYSISPLKLVHQASSRLHKETTNVCNAPLTAELRVMEQPTVSVATDTTALTPTLRRCPVQVCVHKLPWISAHLLQMANNLWQLYGNLSISEVSKYDINITCLHLQHVMGVF